MFRSVGIISKPKKEDVAGIVPPLLAWLRARGLKVLLDQQTGGCVPSAGEVLPREALAKEVDFLLVLGGDGTLLAAARSLDERSIPILPVNLGGLGFLTSVTLDELYPILELVLAGKHRISERMLLLAELIRDGKVVHSQRALNDAVLNKAALARMADFDLQIDDTYVCSYRGDGLIISTPTGSTAYSLAAGGPILFPVLQAFVITPICPHTLTNRPLVVPETSRIRVDCHAGEEMIYLTLDGQVGTEMKHGDQLAVRKADRTLHLVRPTEKTYFEILRSKLKWGER